MLHGYLRKASLGVHVASYNTSLRGFSSAPFAGAAADGGVSLELLGEGTGGDFFAGTGGGDDRGVVFALLLTDLAPHPCFLFSDAQAPQDERYALARDEAACIEAWACERSGPLEAAKRSCQLELNPAYRIEIRDAYLELTSLWATVTMSRQRQRQLSVLPLFCAAPRASFRCRPRRC